jgi:hypothetical protein
MRFPGGLRAQTGAPNVTEHFARHQKTATAQDLLLLGETYQAHYIRYVHGILDTVNIYVCVLYIILYCNILYYITLYHIISYHMYIIGILYYVMSYYIIFRYILYHII